MTIERAVHGAYFPGDGDDWERIAPEEAGWDARLLDAALDQTMREGAGAVLIVQGGRILAECYGEGWGAEVRERCSSIQKSVIALLVGIALQEGRLSLTDPLSRSLGARWGNVSGEAEARITLRHLLTMTSGLDNDLNAVAEPGTVWFYNSPAYYRLKAVLEAATKLPLVAFMRDRLTGPIGAGETDWVGPLLTGQQLRVSARDLARIGLLVLHGGRWGTRTLLADTEYRHAMLRTSQALNPAYGYLWWLNGQDSFLVSGADEQRGGA